MSDWNSTFLEMFVKEKHCLLVLHWYSVATAFLRLAWYVLHF